jgi:ribosome-binding protein aMBF1 (putative translation factor)
MRIDHKHSGDFGKRLKRARQRAGLAQSELARRLKSDQSTISRIERGQAPRSERTAGIMAFIRSMESEPSERLDKIAEAVGQSEELRALISRIVAES